MPIISQHIMPRRAQAFAHWKLEMQAPRLLHVAYVLVIPNVRAHKSNFERTSPLFRKCMIQTRVKCEVPIYK